MRALLGRLEKLEAVQPAPRYSGIRPTGSFALRFAEIIADGKRFEALTAKQQVVELRTKLRRHQDELRQPSRSVVQGLHEKVMRLPFTDVYSRELERAEIRLLTELGYPNAQHPLTPECREILDLELFDA